jgi:hypothetical protein
MKSRRATPPTMMFSIVWGSLEFLAEAGVEPADDEKGHHHADVDEIVHCWKFLRINEPYN